MRWRTLRRVTDDLTTTKICSIYTRWNANSWQKKKQRAVKWNQKKNMMTKAETYSLNGWHPLLQTHAECHKFTSTYEKRPTIPRRQERTCEKQRQLRLRRPCSNETNVRRRDTKGDREGEREEGRQRGRNEKRRIDKRG